MITKDKVTEIFCIIDEFDKNLSAEFAKKQRQPCSLKARSIHNFIMNLCSALTAYCFFENKPEALPVYVQKPRQLELFSY